MIAKWQKPKRVKRKKRRRRRQRLEAGLAPGTLVPPTDASAVEIRVLRYGPDSHTLHSSVDLDELPKLLGRSPVTWVDVTGVGDIQALTRLGELFGIHPLALEDITQVGQRPKVEAYDEDLLVFARMTGENAQLERRLESEQLCLLLRRGLVLTFQERQGDGFDPVRHRIESHKARICSSGADYLAYALLDAVVDRYVLLLDDYESLVEDAEEELLIRSTDDDLERLHRIRRDLIGLRRSAAPMREVLNHILRDTAGVSAFSEETLIFLRDCQDHAIRAVDQIDSTRELVNSLVDLYLSATSHRTNEAMKTLTVIATLFIPLSFFTGLYGMNFDTTSPWNMPELGWRFGYPMALASMAAVFIGLVAYLRRRGLI